MGNTCSCLGKSSTKANKYDLAKTTRSLVPKTNNIEEDYEATGDILGVGINGKVFLCKYTRNKILCKKYAVKVMHQLICMQFK